MKAFKVKKNSKYLKLIWGLAFIFIFTSCSLNEANTGPKLSHHSDDVDFQWDLWPEAEINKPLVDQKIDKWPAIESNSILFVGDESLQGNWGLVLQKSFGASALNSWFLSTCMSARDFKNGGVSTCGYWSEPFKQALLSGLSITIDQTSSGERLAPKLFIDANVSEIVISFGYRVAVMESQTAIQQELSSIELMAKWAHSAGKKCYVIEPVDTYFVETDKNNFLTEKQKNSLKVSIEDYCDWIDAKTLKNDFLSQTHIDVDHIIDSTKSNAPDDYFYAPEPKLEIKDYKSPDQNYDNIEIPKNNLNKEEQVLLPESESMDEIINRKRLQEVAETDEGEQIPENQDDTGETKITDKESFAPSKSLRPVARPERISKSAQQEITRQIKKTFNKTASEELIVKQEASEPKYLWNGYNNGAALTDIGRKYLNNNVASYLKSTRSLRDVKNFCPNYWSLSEKHREYFWIYLFSAIARYENDQFNPKELHLEKRSQRHSIGIFQVDTKNCGYGSDSNREKLYDIDNNFRCALTKGTSLVKNGKQVADGRYSGKSYVDAGLDAYWSVLRKPYVGPAMNKRTGKYENVSLGRREKIIKLTTQISICK